LVGSRGAARLEQLRSPAAQHVAHGDIVRREATINSSATKQRTALVGGGAGGIGRATAERLAADGLQVVISGRSKDALATAAEQLREATGARVEYLVSDLAEPDDAAAAVDEVEVRFGALDVLVVNAGGPPPGRILQVDDRTWRASSELLLLGPLRLARLALPRMAGRGFGRVVVVTSTMVRQPVPDLAISVVLRAAMTSAAKLLAREFAADGVTVNCVAPGATDTARRQGIIGNRAAAMGLDYAELERREAASIPAGRAAEASEIAAAIAFLASDAAGYVNGTVLTVDGGLTETI
jgi:3-oxoacyl-[acyl-carrier protein] reductase